MTITCRPTQDSGDGAKNEHRNTKLSIHPILHIER